MNRLNATVNTVPAVIEEFIVMVPQTRKEVVSPETKTLSLTLTPEQALTLQIILGSRPARFDKNCPAGAHFIGDMYSAMRRLTDVTLGLGDFRKTFDTQYYQDEQARVTLARRWEN